MPSSPPSSAISALAPGPEAGVAVGAVAAAAVVAETRVIQPGPDLHGPAPAGTVLP